MALVCKTCGAVNHDPGGDPTRYLCGVCGQQNLQRSQTPQERSALVAAIAGGAIAGMAGGGPLGIVAGAIIGAIVGSRMPNK